MRKCVNQEVLMHVREFDRQVIVRLFRDLVASRALAGERDEN